MDYYGFDRALYDVTFSSHGDSAVAARVVDAFTQAGLRARTTPRTETRGRDGRGFAGAGLDHGVFVPFRLMFGHSFHSIPIIAASLDSNLTGSANWAVGAAVAQLRKEGVLVLAGGLTAHNLRDLTSFAPDTASGAMHAFHDAVTGAIAISDVRARVLFYLPLLTRPVQPVERKTALLALERHASYKIAHPTADHFVPLYVAAGAGAEGGAHVLSAFYGCHTVAFGV
jgi:aromatic ring-opening dioxygenase catalytic subunit (LigB family)